MIRSIVIPLILLLSANLVLAHEPNQPIKPSESLSGRPLLFENIEVLDKNVLDKDSVERGLVSTHTLTVNQDAVEILIQQIQRLIDSATETRVLNMAVFRKDFPILDIDLDIPDLGIFSDVEIARVARFGDEPDSFTYHTSVYLNSYQKTATIHIRNNDVYFSFDGKAFNHLIFIDNGIHLKTKQKRLEGIPNTNDVITPKLDFDPLTGIDITLNTHPNKLPTTRNPDFYNVLFLYEPEIKATIAKDKARDAIGKFIDLLIGTSNEITAAPKLLEVLPYSYPVCQEMEEPVEDIICTKDTPFSTILTKLKDDTSLLKLRRDKNADLVILLRSKSEPLGGNKFTKGLAYRKYTTRSSEYTHGYGVAILEENVIAHELAHLAGAGHSLYNSVPGTGSAAAVVAEFNHTSGCSIPHKHGYYTFMAYPHVCDAKYEAEYPRACTIQYPGCFKINRFSEPVSVQVDIDTPEQVFIGTATQNNAANIAILSPSIVNYAESIPKNLEPKPVINKISGNNKVWQEQCFNAVGTTDPEDNLKHFDWQVYQGGSYKASKITKSLTEPFCYTPDAHRLYDVKMTAFDTGNLYKQTVYGLQAVTPAARITHLFSDLGKVYISYGVEGNIQPPANVTYKIFEMNKSSSKPIWDAGTQTSATTEDFYRTFNIGDTFAYKVRVCPSPFTCGPASAERQVKVELNNQTGQPVIPYRY